MLLQGAYLAVLPTELLIAPPRHWTLTDFKGLGLSFD
jgi:hypothetical protein